MVTSVTLVDKSAGMIEEGKQKWQRILKGENETFLIRASKFLARAPRNPLAADFVVSDANTISAKFGEDSFDTVVDTFGICSFQDPVGVLQEMRRVCKPEGKILLLEHGVGKYQWMKDYQEKALPGHVANWGCYFNRDIEDLVQQAGLKIESSSRHHFGTTYIIVATPNKEARLKDSQS